MSPTSILETKSLSSIGRQLLSDATKSSGTESKLHARSFGNTDAVGLSIIDALNEEKSTKAFPNSESRRVVFGSLLKVQIPSLCPGSMSPVGSPIEFGIKNKESQLALLSPAESSLGLEMTTSSSCRLGDNQALIDSILLRFNHSSGEVGFRSLSHLADNIPLVIVIMLEPRSGFHSPGPVYAIVTGTSCPRCSLLRSPNGCFRDP
ncbi:hypothetical protein ZIOFF_034555 [Zingiber officinale]|uniref:Uncharacterized protein n=1 Tax=Zingiber officinale TaxID=94328 RepID=A0A8J5L2K1_ZINOF|nr:hypothetical protein ZIOFF_034555 [Zingiber officinale]